MERLKRLFISMVICLPSLALMAFSRGNFIEELKTEGYNVGFNNQDSNMAIFIVAIMLLLTALAFIQKESKIRFVLISSSAALLTASGMDMLFAASYFVTIVGLVLLIFDICKYYSDKILYSNVFINLIIYWVGGLIVASVIYNYEYYKCNNECIPPNSYGLKWRPFYEGFTDKAYFGRIERMVKDNDSTKALKELLDKEMAAVTYDFPILKSKGWEIFDGTKIRDYCGYRLFISPAKEIVYILEYRNDGFDDGFSWVSTPKEHFINFADAEYFFIPGHLIALANDNDSTRLKVRFLNGRDDYGWHPQFISIKDSVLNLSDYDEIDIRNRSAMEDTATMVPIREELFDFNDMLSFKSSDVKNVEVVQNLIRIQFSDKDSTEKIYAVNIGDLIDKKSDRLNRFSR